MSLTMAMTMQGRVKGHTRCILGHDIAWSKRLLAVCMRRTCFSMGKADNAASPNSMGEPVIKSMRRTTKLFILPNLAGYSHRMSNWPHELCINTHGHRIYFRFNFPNS